MSNSPKCSACPHMDMIGRARRTANLRIGTVPRGYCLCGHPKAIETFERVCPNSPRMAGFIDYTAPGEFVPQIKTSPRWCPLRPANAGIEAVPVTIDEQIVIVEDVM